MSNYMMVYFDESGNITNTINRQNISLDNAVLCMMFKARLYDMNNEDVSDKVYTQWLCKKIANKK